MQKVAIMGNNRSSVKNQMKRKYEFSEAQVEEIYEELCKHGIIAPLIRKRPMEARMMDHPRYCKYHQLISHPTQAYFTLKNLLQDLLDSTVLVTEENE